MDIIEVLQGEFKLRKDHVENIIKLIDEGNTIPFIARYRKEQMQNIDFFGGIYLKINLILLQKA